MSHEREEMTGIRLHRKYLFQRFSDILQVFSDGQMLGTYLLTFSAADTVRSPPALAGSIAVIGGSFFKLPVS